MLEIRILGPVEVLKDGHPVVVGGPRQHAVLAVLALDCGRRVSVEQLTDGVWGENAPEASLKTVRAYVSRLRARLGDRVLVPDSGGYRLALAGVALDAGRFAELAEVGRAALADDTPARAERALTEALALWRGATIAEGAQLDGELGRQRQLHELRLATEELRLDALLALARNEEAIASAEALLSADPLREGLWERLMLALHAGGRRADALAAFHRARRAIVEGIGLEPGRSLADLQKRLLQDAMPPPAEAAVHGYLPTPVTSFIGREAELRTLSELIATFRMVTLLGVGGAGKTRLAIELASRWRAETGSPAWFVDLAPLREGRLVPATVAAALGVPEAPNVDPLKVCAERIGARRTLLLLDNCEHLLDAAAEFTVSVLERCPRLRVIATSREVLGVGGEGVYGVPPLATPDEWTPRWRPELPAGYDAVRLFLARALAAGGAWTEEDIPVIAGLCRQLDGLPLAIEFAAARTRSLSIAEIVAGMADRFTVLADTRRAGPDRHRTLSAAIDWSHDLLGDDEQRLFRRLSVFDGGFTTKAAVALAADLPRGAPDLLRRLVDASMLVVESRAAQTRYRLLETIREYAAEQLAAAGELDVAQRDHAAFFCSLAERAAERFQTREEQEWMERIDAEPDNLRAALRWAARRDPELLQRLEVALSAFWGLRLLLDEAVRWLEPALTGARPGSRTEAALRISLGWVRWVHQGHLQEAFELIAAGVRTARALGERTVAIDGLNRLAIINWRQGQFEEAHRLLAELEALTIEHGDPLEIASAVSLRGALAVWEGRYAEAEELLVTALPALKALGPPSQEVEVQQSRAEIAFAVGDYELADELCREVLPLAEQIGDVWHTGHLRNTLARLARIRGALDEATKQALRALDIFGQLRTINEHAHALETLGGLALDRGDRRRAAILLTGAKHLRELTDNPLTEPALAKINQADWARIAELVPAAKKQAASMTVNELTALARNPDTATQPPSP